MIAELLWTAPELLRGSGGSGKASFKGDVFSLGIILQEVLTRGPPYCSWGLSAEGTCPPLQLSFHPIPLSSSKELSCRFSGYLSQKGGAEAQPSS